MRSQTMVSGSMHKLDLPSFAPASRHARASSWLSSQCSVAASMRIPFSARRSSPRSTGPRYSGQLGQLDGADRLGEVELLGQPRLAAVEQAGDPCAQVGERRRRCGHWGRRGSAAARRRSPRAGTGAPARAGGSSRDTGPVIQGGLWRVTHSTAAASAAVRLFAGPARRLGLAGEPLLVGDRVVGDQILLDAAQAARGRSPARTSWARPPAARGAARLALGVGLDHGHGGEPGLVVELALASSARAGGGDGAAEPGFGVLGRRRLGFGQGWEFVRAILIGGLGQRCRRRHSVPVPVCRCRHQPVLDRLAVGEERAQRPLASPCRRRSGSGARCQRSGVARLLQIGAVAAAAGRGRDLGHRLDQGPVGADLQPHRGGHARSPASPRPRPAAGSCCADRPDARPTRPCSPPAAARTSARAGRA